MRNIILLAAASLVFAAAAQTASPACDLITTEEASAAFGQPVRAGAPGTEVLGSSNCFWTNQRTEVVDHGIVLNLMQREALGGGTADFAYELMKTYPGWTPFEELSGIGDKALIVTKQGAPVTSFALAIARGDKLLVVESFGVTREAIVTIATQAAGRM